MLWVFPTVVADLSRNDLSKNVLGHLSMNDVGYLFTKMIIL